jgi:phage terminase small subunit
MNRPLNIRQQRFAELVASGMPATKAYMKAGYSNNPRIAESNACRMMDNDGVKVRIAELRKPQTKAALLTRDRKREMLRDIAEDKSASFDARIRAMAEDSRMAGHYEPDRTEIDVGQRTLQSIRERAAQVGYALASHYSR